MRALVLNITESIFTRPIQHIYPHEVAQNHIRTLEGLIDEQKIKKGTVFIYVKSLKDIQQQQSQ